MKKNLFMILLIIILAVSPLLLQKSAKFNGADGEAKEAIAQINSSYKPWFNNIWTPPSKEIESLLFAVQAALGAGFIGYFIGYTRGKSKLKEEKESKTNVTH